MPLQSPGVQDALLTAAIIRVSLVRGALADRPSIELPGYLEIGYAISALLRAISGTASRNESDYR